MRIRSGYSFKSAYGHLPEVISRLKEIGWTDAPICDRLSTFSFVRWTKACKANGLRPVYGVELPVVPELGLAKPPVDYWAFFAKDNLRDLHQAIWKATSNPGKEPSLTIRQALGMEGLIKVAGERLLIDRLPESTSDDEDFYVGLSPSISRGLFNRAVNRRLKFIATSDNYYPRPDDEELYRVALGWRSGTQTYPRYILSDDELRAWLGSNLVSDRRELLDGAFQNRNNALERARAVLSSARLLEPERPESLRDMCRSGAERLSIDLSSPVYAERLDRELKLIEEKGFGDYFYIVSDMVRWAKTKMVVGPGRGSSGGSLVCYLLDITTIDPIKHGLLFERFIDSNRSELPDIDIDFSDVNRNLVFDYAEQKYGSQRVARLGTVGLFKARSALKQAGASLHIPAWRTDKVIDSIIERTSGDSRALNTLEDTLKETEAGRGLLKEHPEILIAAKFEGHPAIASQHAAGVCLTQDPLIEYVAMDARTKSVMCDKKDAQELNLLKIDALGLKQLSIFERCLELMGEKPVNGWLEKIPLDDPLAFDILNHQHFSGIFQFTGIALRSIANQVTFTRFEDISAMSALVRPGPLATGGTNRWVKRKAGTEPITQVHPMLLELTKETFGVVIYQETVMQVVREIGQFSWEDTGAIRHAMSGILGDEYFNKFRDKFIIGAANNGIDKETALAIWNQISTMGSWAFNKSHSVAYGLVSYYCCYLKAHYPLEFAAATLDAEPEPSNQLALLRELDREGIKYTSVDPDASTDRWSITDHEGAKRLVGPLTSIKGIGPAKVREILEARKQGIALKPGIRKSLETAKTPLDDLYPIAAKIKRLHPDLSKINIISEPLPVEKVQPGVRGEVMIFAKLRRSKWRDENDAQKLIQRNGRKLAGPTSSLNTYFTDDTDEIFCKVGRYDFERIGREVMEKGRTGQSLYAIKGTVPSDFRMISIKQIRYLGEMDGKDPE